MHAQAVFFDLDNTLTHRLRSIESYASLFAQHYAAQLGRNVQALIAQVIAEQDNGGYLPADSVHGNIRTAVASALRDRLQWRTPVPMADLRTIGWSISRPKRWRCQAPTALSKHWWRGV